MGTDRIHQATSNRQHGASSKQEGPAASSSGQAAESRDNSRQQKTGIRQHGAGPTIQAQLPYIIPPVYRCCFYMRGKSHFLLSKAASSYTRAQGEATFVAAPKSMPRMLCVRMAKHISYNQEQQAQYARERGEATPVAAPQIDSMPPALNPSQCPCPLPPRSGPPWYAWRQQQPEL